MSTQPLHRPEPRPRLYVVPAPAPLPWWHPETVPGRRLQVAVRFIVFSAAAVALVLGIAGALNLLADWLGIFWIPRSAS